GREPAAGGAEPQDRRGGGRCGLRDGQGPDGLSCAARPLPGGARGREGEIFDAMMNSTDTRLDFENRKALVTGSSPGIGRAVCLELARRGADVALIYRSRDAQAEETQAQVGALGRRALAVKCDLADARDVDAAVDRAAGEFGGIIDVLVQAAGAMGAWRETADLSVEDWDRYLAVDLSGAFYLI